MLQEATCTEDGKKAYVCTRCNAEIDPEVIPATGHNPKYEVVTEAGLFTKGAAHTICTTCGKTLSEEVLLSAVPFRAVCVGGIVVIAIVGVFLVRAVRRRKVM